MSEQANKTLATAGSKKSGTRAGNRPSTNSSTPGGKAYSFPATGKKAIILGSSSIRCGDG